MSLVTSNVPSGCTTRTNGSFFLIFRDSAQSLGRVIHRKNPPLSALSGFPFPFVPSSATVSYTPLSYTISYITDIVFRKMVYKRQPSLDGTPWQNYLESQVISCSDWQHCLSWLILMRVHAGTSGRNDHHPYDGTRNRSDNPCRHPVDYRNRLDHRPAHCSGRGRGIYGQPFDRGY